MNYCQRGRDMLMDLKRSDWLPSYDDEGVRTVADEINKLYSLIAPYTNDDNLNDINDSLKIFLLFHSGCLDQNMKYIKSYNAHRLNKIRRARWETGAILPPSTGSILSANETDYFTEYNNLLEDHMAEVGLDFSSNIEPPKELYIEVRVLKSCGVVLTENGPVSLDKGSSHFLRRVDIEQFIRQGFVEHCTSSTSSV